MDNIALLVPNEEMFRQAHDVLQEMKERLGIIRVINTENAVTEARQAIRQGAEIIIARGLQATMIKQYTDIPVVEIILTEQDIRDMLERAKRILEKEHPVIALVMFRNMACDMAELGRECGVELREYYVQNPELLSDTAVQAIEDKAELLIGGATVLKIADGTGVPGLFLANTEAAMRNAISEALRLAGALRSGSEEYRSRRTEKKPPFVNFPYRSERMECAVKLAEKLAAADCPKLLVEPQGNLYRAFAHAIHNASRHSHEKLIQYQCLQGESDYSALFGKTGKVSEAGKGTLQINFIENLDMRSQQELLEILMFRHIIVVTRKPELAGDLIPELYERLRAFAVRIPTLMETPEDIPYLTDVYARACMERYGKYHSLTASAKQCIRELSWDGGRIQLESFLERLVLSAESRSIREEEVQALYQELYRGDRESLREGLPETSDSQSRAEKMEQEKILAELTRHMGNRDRTAEALGISKTTLWRKLKKYRLI